jgi:hypothetical protein
VREHIEQEEQQVFALLEQLRDDRPRRLGEQLRACAKRLLSQGTTATDPQRLCSRNMSE